MIKNNKLILTTTFLLSSSILANVAHADTKQENDDISPSQKEANQVMNHDGQDTKIPEGKFRKASRQAPQPRGFNVQGTKLGDKINSNTGLFQNVEKNNVIHPINGYQFNFFPRWTPKKDSSGKLTNFELFDEGSDAYLIRNKNTQEPVEMKPSSDSITGYTFVNVGGKGYTDKPFGARYKNVGMFFDKSKNKLRNVDLEISFYSPTVWDEIEKQNLKESWMRCVTVGSKGISFATEGLSEIGVHYQLRYSDGAREPLDLSETGWYLNFEDIDALQGIKMYDGTNKYDKILGHPREVNRYITGNGITNICDQENYIGNTEPPYSGNIVDQDSVSYDGVFATKTPNIYFRWTKNYLNTDKSSPNYTQPIQDVKGYYDKYGGKKTDSNTNVGVQMVGGNYLAYMGKKQALSYIPVPTKTVHDEDETNKDTDSRGTNDENDYKNQTNTSNTLTKNHPYNSFRYTIDTMIPDETENYGSWEMIDKIDDRLEVTNISMDYFDTSKNKWVKNGALYDDGTHKRFKASVDSNNNVSIKADSSMLKRQSNLNPYGKKYRINIDVKRKQNVWKSELDAGEIKYTNHAYVKATSEDGTKLYTGSGQKTNDVVTTQKLSDETQQIKLQKTASENVFYPTTSDDDQYKITGGQHIISVAPNENLTYAIKFKVPEWASKIEFSDYIDPSITIGSERHFQIYDDGWKDVPAGDVEWTSSQLEQDSNQKAIGVKIKDSAISKYRGKTLRVYAEGKVNHHDYINENGDDNKKGGQQITNKAKIDFGIRTATTNEVEMRTPTVNKAINFEGSRYVGQSNNKIENVDYGDVFDFDILLKTNGSEDYLHIWDNLNPELTRLKGEGNTELQYYDSDSKSWKAIPSSSDIKWDNTDNKVDVTIQGDTMKKYSNRELRLHIRCKWNTTNTKLTSIKNTAHWADGTGNTYDTDEVVATPSKPTTKPTVKKYIKDSNNNWVTSDQLGKRKGDKVEYKVEYKIPDHYAFDTVHLWDSVDKRTKLDQNSVKLTIDGKTINDSDAKLSFNKEQNGDITIDWNSNPSNGTSDDFNKYAGKTIVMTYSGIVDNVTKDSTKTKVPNDSAFKLNIANQSSDDTFRSNIVNYGTVIAKDPMISKKILNSDNKEVNELRDVVCGMPLNYHILIEFPDGDTYTNFEISDDLNDFLDLNDVIVKDGDKDVTSDGTLILDKEKESFKWSPKDTNAYRGKKLTLEVKSKLKYDYKIKDGMKIPNTAHLKINEKDTPSNEVPIYPKVIEPSAEKWIIEKD